MERLTEGPRVRPRITGAVYALYFVTAISGVLVAKGLVVAGDAAATASNILAHDAAFRLGIAINLVGTALYIAVTALLYDLLKPVNRIIALLAALVSVAGCAIQAIGSLFQVASLSVLEGDRYLSVFSVEQLHALALMFLKLNVQAAYIYLVFFGLFDFLIGYLILRSTFLPRIIGVLMALAGLGWLTFLSPPLALSLSPYNLALGFLAEFALLLWLLIRGVNAQRWAEQALP